MQKVDQIALQVGVGLCTIYTYSKCIKYLSNSLTKTCLNTNITTLQKYWKYLVQV